jgi:hypothetical protein
MTAAKPFSEEAQRYLDGETGVRPSDAERVLADRLVEAGMAYAARLVPPGEELEAVVMAAVRRATREPGSVWQWFTTPQPLRLRPATLALAAGVAALLLVAVGRIPPRHGAETASSVAALPPGTVVVRFELVAPQARRVSLTGSFNGWRRDGIQLTPTSEGVWAVSVPLSPGEHRYLFVVDGERWVTDPRADAQVPDGFGGTNSLIVVGPPPGDRGT